MATAAEAREQLSRDLGDWFSSTTTAAGLGDGTTLEDDLLTEYDDDEFLQGYTNTSVLVTSGADDGNERGTSSKSGSTITLSRAFDNQVATSVSYEVHRLFRASEKDDAITQALHDAYPVLFTVSSFTFTIVEDQFDYDITGASYHRDTPHQVRWVSELDSELDRPVYNWWVTPDNKLHLEDIFPTDDTIKLWGIAPPALSAVTTKELQILSSYAAIYLLENAVSENPNKQVGRIQQLLQLNQRRLTERRAKHAPIPPAAQQPMQTLKPPKTRYFWESM